MKNDTLFSLIVKYLSGSLDMTEISRLNNLIDKKENKIVFKNLIKTDYSLNLAMSTIDTEKIKNEVLRKIRENKKLEIRRRNTRYLKYAAVFVLGMSILAYSYFTYNNHPDAINNSLVNTDEIILELEDGTKKIIKANGQQEIIGQKGEVLGQQKGNTLLYSHIESQKQLVYNKLNIPNGRKFEIILADGTKVHLNSGSSLKYPVSFTNTKNRKVFLEGEAFFDVTENKEQPFVVVTDDIDVTVLGTEFNISNYPEETSIKTVLVEGKVEVTAKTQNGEKLDSKILAPNQLATTSKGGHETFITTVDTNVYTAWRTGHLNFKATPFNQIIKRLERNFNVTIENRYKPLEKQIYTAWFYEGESVVDILGYLKHETDFYFNKVDNHIIITRPN